MTQIPGAPPAQPERLDLASPTLRSPLSSASTEAPGAYTGQHLARRPASGKGWRLPRSVPGPDWAGVALVSLADVLFSWRVSAWRPATGGPLPSWQPGLALGFMHHLQWGPQVVFTFGPYGFVEDILPFYRLTAGLALVYAIALTWGLAALIVTALRKSWGLIGAGTVAWALLAVGTNLLEASELGLATALGLALASFRTERERDRLLLLAGLGALAGLQLLVEVNVGAVTLCLGAVAAAISAAAQQPRTKTVAVTGAGAVTVFLVGWVAAGQSLSNLASYVRGSLSVATGYGSAMSIDGHRPAQDWYALALALVAAALLALALKGRPAREKAAVAVIVIGWGWAVTKEGFVRHDLHDLTFFGLVLLALGLLRLPRRLLPIQAGAFGVGLVLTCLAVGAVPRSVYSPGADIRAIGREVYDLSVTSRWATVEGHARQQMLATGDSLPQKVLGDLQGKTMAAEPWEDALSFAYPQLYWDPEPVLQAYSAYTSYLDRLDASFLASSRAPERLLYQPRSIDGRDPWMDPPATTAAMYCHYAQVEVVGGWQVLARVPNRCGAPRLISTATAHFGQPVPVPSVPGKMVEATFSLGTPFSSEIQGVLLKAPPISIAVWGVLGSTPAGYRFIPGTAQDFHVLRTPRSLGYARTFSPPGLVQIELSGGGWAKGQGTVKIAFYAVSVRSRLSGSPPPKRT
jgi:hypothetical protein